MSVRLPPSVLSNELFLRQALDEEPGTPIAGTPRTLNRASLDSWGRSGDTWTFSRPAGGFYMVRGYSADSEGWFESWTGRVQTSPVVDSEEMLTSGKPLAQADAARVSVSGSTAGGASASASAKVPAWLVVAIALAVAWKVMK